MFIANNCMPQFRWEDVYSKYRKSFNRECYPFGRRLDDCRVNGR
ncbi:hypothetical protein CRE_12212 [Caenorhabditis remanei]|uniref:Uncharacterized protein n=1 Tax=Caenorhabditis remanei TaxID=31234 RepID=E3N0A1_CAERE|nr:hypothetical protein CRE_12212 [Caenorhabditis remanei]